MKKYVFLSFVAASLMTTPLYAANLKVAADCTYPPFGYRDTAGEVQGFDVDIAREIGKRMERNVEIVCQEWDGMIPGLLAGKFDLISASMSITEERLKSINFSQPFRSSSARFVGPVGSDALPFLDDGTPNPAGVEGKTIGVQRSSMHAQYIKDKLPQARVNEYDTVDNMILDLQSGRLDLVLAGPIKLDNDFLSKAEGEGFHFIGGEHDAVEYFGPGIGIGMRKEDEELRLHVDNALSALIKDRTFKTINEKYWSFNVLPASFQVTLD